MEVSFSLKKNVGRKCLVGPRTDEFCERNSPQIQLFLYPQAAFGYFILPLVPHLPPRSGIVHLRSVLAICLANVAPLFPLGLPVLRPVPTPQHFPHPHSLAGKFSLQAANEFNCKGVIFRSWLKFTLASSFPSVHSCGWHYQIRPLSL